ncbi:acyl-CoA/acyl-ACP dehydrogenase [Streptomyces sp. YPW6]|uniref:acyl-CoA dehydrogenase family protein n=1 Tax=Streptomyces sp. YPW6 TaxID=2840373 RepID=UPI001C0CA8E5|nr:acyl-CoA dehydrogenase family protein [Streptomyces sp. YPW6]QWQ41872.1 acyl-CoA/acyl-ACP dehydrogenase [Streptomyces sp. YPW6]
MDFQLSDDQRALRSGMRDLLGAVFDRDRLRAAVERDGALDRSLWRELGAAGFFALRLPEDEGGVGLGLPEAVLLFEEAGRALLPGPLVATHLAAGRVKGAAEGEAVVTAVDGELPVAHLAEADAVLLVGGEAVSAREARQAPQAPQARELPDGRTLTGEALRAFLAAARPVRSMDPLTPLHRAPAGAAAAVGRVPTGRPPTAEGGRAASERARAEADRAPAASERTRADTDRAPVGAEHPGADTGRVAGAVACTGVGADRVAGAVARTPAYAGRLRFEAALLTAAEQLGSAVRTTEAAVQHARDREQFGSPIGSFQAVKHLCADMLARTEPARAAVYAAAVTGDPLEIAAAKLLADEAAVRNARDCLQIHGGMGFTWEADVHLHLKRAWLRAASWLTGAAAEELLAAGLGAAGPLPRSSAAYGRPVPEAGGEG